MAEKRSKIGQDINTIRETLKQKKITDTMSDVEADKLFKPITSGLKLTQPKPIKRRLVRKKAEVPDYGINIEDEGIPDYNLEDLFDEGVQPQNTKQLVPKPPSYDEVLKDLETGKKKLSINPEYMPQLEDPPEYEEDEVPDYGIFEEDRINETLDELGITNYDEIEAQLNRDDMTEKNETFLFVKENRKYGQEKTTTSGLQDTYNKAVEQRFDKPS